MSWDALQQRYSHACRRVLEEAMESVVELYTDYWVCMDGSDGGQDGAWSSVRKEGLGSMVDEMEGDAVEGYLKPMEAWCHRHILTDTAGNHGALETRTTYEEHGFKRRKIFEVLSKHLGITKVSDAPSDVLVNWKNATDQMRRKILLQHKRRWQDLQMAFYYQALPHWRRQQVLASEWSYTPYHGALRLSGKEGLGEMDIAIEITSKTPLPLPDLPPILDGRKACKLEEIGQYLSRKNARYVIVSLPRVTLDKRHANGYDHASEESMRAYVRKLHHRSVYASVKSLDGPFSSGSFYLVPFTKLALSASGTRQLAASQSLHGTGMHHNILFPGKLGQLALDPTLTCLGIWLPISSELPRSLSRTMLEEAEEDASMYAELEENANLWQLNPFAPWPSTIHRRHSMEDRCLNGHDGICLDTENGGNLSFSKSNSSLNGSPLFIANGIGASREPDENVRDISPSSVGGKESTQTSSVLRVKNLVKVHSFTSVVNRTRDPRLFQDQPFSESQVDVDVCTERTNEQALGMEDKDASTLVNVKMSSPTPLTPIGQSKLRREKTPINTRPILKFDSTKPLGEVLKIETIKQEAQKLAQEGRIDGLLDLLGPSRLDMKQIKREPMSPQHSDTSVASVTPAGKTVEELLGMLPSPITPAKVNP